MTAVSVYIASSFKHLHGVRLLGRELRRLGCVIWDWTEKAVPPPGLTPQERRIWMDTDQHGGQVYDFCKHACLASDLVIYYGASGQDAGVEIGLAAAAGAPVLGITGPLEGPGLMLHGAVTAWAASVDEALDIVEEFLRLREKDFLELPANPETAARKLANAARKRNKNISEG